MTARHGVLETAAAATVANSLAAARRWATAIDAFAWLAPEAAAAPIDGPLAGAPFAVKDVIDVAGMPTGLGWAARADGPPAPRDAAVVAALRAAGARPIGKTRSTAFAFVDPTTTRNPYDPARTPGGSSSGSGAAVGAGVVPFALGTQTAGSLCRPAAYCGAFAWKPSLGALPTAGMAPLSRSFDAVGVIAGSFDWLGRVYAVLADAFGLARPAAAQARLRIGRVSSPDQAPEPAMAAAMQSLCARLVAAGHDVVETTPAASFARLIEWHRTVMLAEAARDVLPIIGSDRDRLPPRLAEGLREGEAISAAEVIAAETRIHATRVRAWDAFAGFDVLIACPAPGAAPLGLATTGDQSYLTPWTALGGPLTVVPAGLDRSGMPLGLLLAAAPGRDAALMAATAAVAALAPPVSRPRPPR